MEGEAIMTWKDGTYFKGNYHNGLVHGNGAIFYNDGRKWEGIYDQGVRQEVGQEIYTKKNGTVGVG